MSKIEGSSAIFSINRKKAWQIVKETAKRVGIQKKVYPHLFRHSDAIERLRQTGNPKALQYHLGHSSTMMTMRYLATLTAEDALKIQQRVQFVEDCDKRGGMSVSFGLKGTTLGLKCHQFEGYKLS